MNKTICLVSFRDKIVEYVIVKWSIPYSPDVIQVQLIYVQLFADQPTKLCSSLVFDWAIVEWRRQQNTNTPIMFACIIKIEPYCRYTSISNTINNTASGGIVII